MTADPAFPETKPRSVLLRERQEVADVQVRSLQFDLLRLIAMVGKEDVPAALAPLRLCHGYLVDAHNSLTQARQATGKELATRFADELPGYDEKP